MVVYETVMYPVDGRGTYLHFRCSSSTMRGVPLFDLFKVVQKVSGKECKSPEPIGEQKRKGLATSFTHFSVIAKYSSSPLFKCLFAVAVKIAVQN